jgi:hypothetical protein
MSYLAKIQSVYHLCLNIIQSYSISPLTLSKCEREKIIILKMIIFHSFNVLPHVQRKFSTSINTEHIHGIDKNYTILLILRQSVSRGKLGYSSYYILQVISHKLLRHLNSSKALGKLWSLMAAAASDIGTSQRKVSRLHQALKSVCLHAKFILEQIQQLNLITATTSIKDAQAKRMKM